MHDDCPLFADALIGLGETRRERAAALQTDVKTVDRLLQRLPKQLAIFRQHPDVLRALADDFAANLIAEKFDK